MRPQEVDSLVADDHAGPGVRLGNPLWEPPL